MRHKVHVGRDKNTVNFSGSRIGFFQHGGHDSLGCLAVEVFLAFCFNLVAVRRLVASHIEAVAKPKFLCLVRLERQHTLNVARHALTHLVHSDGVVDIEATVVLRGGDCLAQLLAFGDDKLRKADKVVVRHKVASINDFGDILSFGVNSRLVVRLGRGQGVVANAQIHRRAGRKGFQIGRIAERFFEVHSLSSFL